MDSLLQEKPTNARQVEDCLDDSARAQWVAPYILKTVEAANKMVMLDDRPVYFWEGAWGACSAIQTDKCA